MEYVLKHSKNLTNEDKTFKKHWESWKQKGLTSQQTITVVKRRMGLPQKECTINHYMKKMSKFPQLKQFVTMEYVTDPQPLMLIKNKHSTRSTSKMKQLTMHRRSRSMTPRKLRSIPPRTKTTSMTTPRKVGGVYQTPTVKNLSRDRMIQSKAAENISMEDTKTPTSSATDTDEFLSVQGSSISNSESVLFEYSTSNVTDVSELSKGVEPTAPFTIPTRSRQDRQYFAVAQGRKPGIYTDPEEYDRQLKGYVNAKSEVFNTRKQDKTYLDEHEQSNVSTLQLVPALEAIKDGHATTIQATDNEFDNMSFDTMNRGISE